jgi:translation elongation factor EF-Tu-like GTPase
MFTIRVNSIFRIAGRGMVLAGHVESGKVWIGSRALLRTPAASVVTVLTGLERNREIVSQAAAGEDVGILIQDLDPATLSTSPQKWGYKFKPQVVVQVEHPP